MMLFLQNAIIETFLLSPEALTQPRAWFEVGRAFRRTTTFHGICFLRSRRPVLRGIAIAAPQAADRDHVDRKPWIVHLFSHDLSQFDRVG